MSVAFCIHWNAKTTVVFVIVSGSEVCPIVSAHVQCCLIVSAHVQFGELLRACPKRVYLHMRCVEARVRLREH